MKLTHYTFGEHMKSDERWTVENFLVDPVTLFVGKNGSGKSRLLNSIGALAAMIAGRREVGPSGEWDVGFEHSGRSFKYVLKTSSDRILSESLMIDDKNFVTRSPSGEGSMLSEGIHQMLPFKLPEKRLAAARADSIQYSYLVPLQDWANDLKKYAFGSEFGRNVLFAASPEESVTDPAVIRAMPPENVVAIYHDGYERFGEKFDRAILKDFRAVGYDCTDVFSYPVNVGDAELPAQIRHKIPMGLGVQERDLKTTTRQIEMSNGMFRAVALIINLQHVIMSKARSTILIDDIGEGLDFERSTSLIRLLISRCRKNDIQLLMTTNDRFVMNEVDLSYWHIVNRSGHDVRILDYDNSKDIFDQFKYLGLSNFDFFSREVYLGNKH